MARYSRSNSRGRWNSKRDKYSIEHTSVSVTSDSEGNGISTIVFPTDIQGMRKVKHLTVSLSSLADQASFWWAIVYVPQGTTANQLNITDGQSLYEPNQFVMNSGYIDPNAGPIRMSTNLSRNLNSGDGIALVLKANSTNTTQFRGLVTYAITLQ